MAFGRTLPAWSPFAKRREHDAFVAACTSHLAAIWGEVVVLEDGRMMSPAADPATVVSLDNVAAMASQVARPDWPGLLASHFRAFATDRAPIVPSVDALRVRLVSADFLAAAGTDIPTRTHADDLYEALALDTPIDVQLLELDGYESLGLTEAELFDRARENVLQHEPVEVEHIDDVGGVAITIIESDSFYTTTHALALDRLLEIPPGGVLLGLPDRHVILAHRVLGIGAVAAVETLIKLTFERFRTQPGNLSPHLYWWHDGQLERQQVVVSENGAVQFTPGPGFVQVLG